MSFREPQTPGIGLTGQFTNAEFNILLELISSGGVSTFLYEVPVGTVNGSNKTFTVENVPIFIDTSGQVNVSQTQDSTNYGFTVSGTVAPYTITFVNAPTQTPHSFFDNGGEGTNIDNEIVSGSGITFTLANTPALGSQAIYGQGQRLYPTLDYTISGAVLTMSNGWLTGQILADYLIDTNGAFIHNEIVSGSGTSFTLANTPLAGTQEVYGNGQRLYPTTDYTISSATITTVNSWLTGQILADYET